MTFLTHTVPAVEDLKLLAIAVKSTEKVSGSLKLLSSALIQRKFSYPGAERVVCCITLVNAQNRL